MKFENAKRQTWTGLNMHKFANGKLFVIIIFISILFEVATKWVTWTEWTKWKHQTNNLNNISTLPPFPTYSHTELAIEFAFPVCTKWENIHAVELFGLNSYKFGRVLTGN